MKKKIILLFSFLFFSVFNVNAQVGIGTTTPDTSAALDISHTAKGLLIPRLTNAQVGSLVLPANGLIIFNKDENMVQINRGTSIAPNFQFLGIRSNERWLDTVINGDGFIFAKNALSNNDTVLVSDDGRLLIGSRGLSYDSTIKFAVTPGAFNLSARLGTDVHFNHSLIMDETADFKDPDTHIQISNLSGLVWTPTLDHPRGNISNANFLILDGSTDISGALYNDFAYTGTYSSGDLGEITNISSEIAHMGSGTIEYVQGLFANVTAGGDSGKIKKAIAINIGNVSSYNTAVVEDAVGLSILDQIRGTNSSYAIYSYSKADSYFKGHIGINTDDPQSTNDINGSLGTALNFTNANITLDSSHHTLIVTANTPTITLPDANTCNRRMYIIVNNTGNSLSISTPGSNVIRDIGGTAITTLNAGTSYTLQSSGGSNVWFVITKSN